jgi:hypothetical protein
MAVGMKRVFLHIDRLILRGFRHADRHAVADGLQGELTHLLAGSVSAQALASLGHVSHLRAGNITLAQHAKPRASGVTAARAIFKGLSR